MSSRLSTKALYVLIQTHSGPGGTTHRSKVNLRCLSYIHAVSNKQDLLKDTAALIITVVTQFGLVTHTVRGSDRSVI